MRQLLGRVMKILLLLQRVRKGVYCDVCDVYGSAHHHWR